MLVKFHFVWAAVLGFILDFFIGDPCWLFHPVRLIGKLILIFEKLLLLPNDSKAKQRIKGFVFVLMILTFVFFGTYIFLHLLLKFNFVLGFVFESVVCFWCIAAADLKKESMAVYKKLAAAELKEARDALARIVGRDTKNLDEEKIVKAAVETIAESSNDGVIAPLFYLLSGGPVLGMIYKAVNTMDSMVGYKNEKYKFFGTAAAKLDDVLGFMPARLSAAFSIFSCLFLRFDFFNAARIFFRDRYKHESPNSAQTESVYAGALDIQLGGDAYYAGILEKKEKLGDEIKKACMEDIKKANALMYSSSVIALLIFSFARIIFTLL